MNSMLYNSISILGAAAFMVASSGLPSQAESTQSTPETVSSETSLQSEVSLQDNSPAFVLDLEGTETADNAASSNEVVSGFEAPVPAEPMVTETPLPGTVITSASALQGEATDSFAPEATTAEAETETDETVVAQALTPGRATRSGPSYVAAGVNIGFGDRTALGETNFVITSKIGLTNYLSARPGLVVGGSPTILLPITIDFPVGAVVADRFSIAPFVGGGLAISTRGGSEVRALAMGGIDVPLSEQFTFTASANAAFFRRPEIGVILGVGYNF